MKKVIQFNLTSLEAIWLATTHTIGHAMLSRNTPVARHAVEQLQGLETAIKVAYPGGMDAFVTMLNTQIALIYGIQPCPDCGRFHDDQSAEMDTLTIVKESL